MHLKALSSAAAGLTIAGTVAACGGSGGSDKPLPAAAKGLPQSDTIQHVADSGELRAGVAIALPWLGKDPQSGQYFGSSVRLTEAIAQKLGAKVKWVPSSFDNVIAALQSGQVDFIAAPLLQTPERLQAIDMVPFTKGGTCYLVKKSNGSINTLADLDDPSVTIATFQGTGQETQTKHKYPKAKVISRAQAPGETVPWPEVASGKAQVAPFDSSLAKINAAKHPDAKVVPADCLQHPDLETPIDVGYTKGDKGFGELVKKVVADNQAQLDADNDKYSDPKYAGAGG
jgi:polar amino acid transport system substrate-binding protein